MNRQPSANPLTPSMQRASGASRPKPLSDSIFDDQPLVKELEIVVANSSTLNELLTELAKITSHHSNCLALWITPRQSAESTQSVPDGEPQPTSASSNRVANFHPLIDEAENSIWPAVEDTARTLVNHLESTQQISATPLPFRSTAHLVAAPVRTQLKIDQPHDFVLLGCFETDQHSVLRLQWLLGFAATSIQQWSQLRSQSQLETQQRALTDALKLIQVINQSTSQSEAAIAIVNQLRQLLNVHSVALSIKGSLSAVSDVEQVDPHNETNRLTRIACEQTLETGEAVVFFPEAEISSPQQLALEAFCRSQRVEACLNLPLGIADQPPLAGLLVAGTAKRLSEPGFAEYLSQLSGLLGPQLEIVLRANRGVKEFATEKIQKLRKHRWRTRVLFLIAALGIAMCFPVPYRIKCDCEMQPVLRRYVAAPFDGILERTLVANGEIVTKDQLLAKLDGRNLRIELAGLHAELAGAKKKGISEKATGAIGQSQITESETKRLAAKISLLEQRTTNLEIRSPIDGIVVSGDLEKVEGAPLEMGQTLFEVAPLDKMLGEIAIPESEIKYVRPDMEVDIKLNAFPFQTWTGTIEAVYPSAEMIENESVFVAQVLLSNDGVSLRPGMKGTAKVRSQSAPLGWTLFHRPWETVRYWTVW